MKKKCFFLWLFVSVSFVNLYSQCDTGFYDFKRGILEIASKNMAIEKDIDTSNKYIVLEFSNFTGYSYIVGNPYGVMGFYCFRQDSCDYFPYDKPFWYQDSIKCYLADKTNFELFITSGQFGIFEGSKNRFHSILIEDPVEGWAFVEHFYFFEGGTTDTWKKKTVNPILISIPIYIFVNKEMKKAYLVRVELSGTTREGIKILDKKNFSF